MMPKSLSLTPTSPVSSRKCHVEYQAIPQPNLFFSCSLLFIRISFYSVDKDRNLGVSFDTFFSLIFLHLITPSTSISTFHIFLKSFLSSSDRKTHVHHSFPSNASFLPTAPRASQPQPVMCLEVPSTQQGSPLASPEA